MIRTLLSIVNPTQLRIRGRDQHDGPEEIAGLASVECTLEVDQKLADLLLPVVVALVPRDFEAPRAQNLRDETDTGGDLGVAYVVTPARSGTPEKLAAYTTRPVLASTSSKPSDVARLRRPRKMRVRWRVSYSAADV